VPIPETENIPYDPGTGPEDRDVPFLAWHKDLSVDGYLEEEILMSGTARSFEYVDGENENPVVQPVDAEPTAYTTRVLIRRPADSADFNGVVYMEILNATARYDGAPMWNLTYHSMIDAGAAWVGVTYSDTAANFMRDTWGTNDFPAPAEAQPRNNSRYATLNIPSRTLTWDILNQAAALLKSTADERNPMQGFAVDTIIATGYSQSAAYVVTFSNSFYPFYSEAAPCTDELKATDDCTPIVDGYIVAAGGPSARLMNGAGSHPIGDNRNYGQALNRLDPDGEHEMPKTVRFTTESDIKSVRVRQSMADQPSLRTYEVAGTSHVDYWGRVVGRRVGEYQFGPRSRWTENVCDLPFNPLRTGISLSAIQYRLARWIQADETPPPSHFIEFEGDFDEGTQAWVRDSDGNVIGGVRPPRIEVPLGAYSGSNLYSGPLPSTAEIFCTGIIGGFDPFDAAELEARYVNRSMLVDQTWLHMWRSYIEGFLLAVDAPSILKKSMTQGLVDP
jgi:hypothetical protein